MSSGRIRTSLHLCPPVTSGRGPGPLSTDIIIMKLSVGVEHVTGFVSKLFAAAMSDPAALTTAFILSSPSYSGLPLAVRRRSLSIPFRKHYSSSIHRSSWPFFNVPCSPCSSTSSWSSLYSSSTFSLPFCHLPIFQHWWKYSLTFDVFPDLLFIFFQTFSSGFFSSLLDCSDLCSPFSQDFWWGCREGEGVTHVFCLSSFLFLTAWKLMCVFLTWLFDNWF